MVSELTPVAFKEGIENWTSVLRNPKFCAPVTIGLASARAVSEVRVKMMSPEKVCPSSVLSGRARAVHEK